MMLTQQICYDIAFFNLRRNINSCVNCHSFRNTGRCKQCLPDKWGNISGFLWWQGRPCFNKHHFKKAPQCSEGKIIWNYHYFLQLDLIVSSQTHNTYHKALGPRIMGKQQNTRICSKQKGSTGKRQIILQRWCGLGSPKGSGNKNVWKKLQLSWISSCHSFLGLVDGNSACLCWPS